MLSLLVWPKVIALSGFNCSSIIAQSYGMRLIGCLSFKKTNTLYFRKILWKKSTIFFQLVRLTRPSTEMAGQNAEAPRAEAVTPAPAKVFHQKSRRIVMSADCLFLTFGGLSFSNSQLACCIPCLLLSTCLNFILDFFRPGVRWNATIPGHGHGHEAVRTATNKKRFAKIRTMTTKSKNVFATKRTRPRTWSSSQIPKWNPETFPEQM